MPRDNMVSLIQKIARQACLTFPASSLGATGGGTKGFAEQLSQLNNLVSELRAEDLRIAPRGAPPPPGAGGAAGLGPAPAAGPPVTYMHICETPAFSMGVFLLQSGQACIPLHDHPGMHGMLKVLYGQLSIRGYDRLPEEAPPPSRPEGPHLRRALRRPAGLFGPDSPPCLLGPHKDNLHQIAALEGPAAFLDILAPPYDPDDGRDCHYYRVLPKPESGPEAGKEEEVWLLEIPQPADFWCGGEPYPGPKVTL